MTAVVDADDSEQRRSSSSPIPRGGVSGRRRPTKKTRGHPNNTVQSTQWVHCSEFSRFYFSCVRILLVLIQKESRQG